MVDCKVIGGATFPGRFGGIYASWPMMVLFITDSGVLVAPRWSWVGELLVWGANPGWGVHHEVLEGGRWQAAWPELVHVDIGGLRGATIRFVKRDGDACDFGAPQAAKLSGVRQEIARRAVPSRRVLLLPRRPTVS